MVRKSLQTDWNAQVFKFLPGIRNVKYLSVLQLCLAYFTNIPGITLAFFFVDPSFKN